MKGEKRKREREGKEEDEEKEKGRTRDGFDGSPRDTMKTSLVKQINREGLLLLFVCK